MNIDHLTPSEREIAARASEPRNVDDYPPAYHQLRADCRTLLEAISKEREKSGRPKVVCICGSMKFFRHIAAHAAFLTLNGEIVVKPEIQKSLHARPENPEMENRLDELHFHKIRMADEIHFVALGGYMGTSTSKEYKFAESLGKPIHVFSEIESYWRDFDIISPLEVDLASLRAELAVVTNSLAKTEMALDMRGRELAAERERLVFHGPEELPVGIDARIVQVTHEKKRAVHVHEAHEFQMWMFENSEGWIYESDLLAAFSAWQKQKGTTNGK